MINNLYTLEDLTEYLIKVLNNERRTSIGIAAACATFFLKEAQAPGTALPTQLQLAARLDVKIIIARAACIRLRDYYKIIITSPRRGTQFISYISKEHKDVITKQVNQSFEDLHKLRLGNKYIEDFDPVYNRKKKDALMYYRSLSSDERNLRIIPKFREVIAENLSLKFGYQLGSDEVFYTNDYSEAIKICCETFCPSKSHVVIMSPVSARVHNAVVLAKRKRKCIRINPLKEMFNEFEELCGKIKVGIVYFGTTAQYPRLYEKDDESWYRLHLLQKKHDFKILVDDRFAQMIEEMMVFKGIEAGSNTSIITLSTLSIDEDLHKANVITACPEDTRRIMRSFKGKGELLSPSLAYGLWILMKDHIIEEYETAMYVLLKEMVAVAGSILILSGLFVEEYIIKQQGYFFYLELKEGRFPRAAFNKFKERGIFIMDLKIYRNQTTFKEGIFVSIANYPIKASLENALAKFIKYTKSIKK